MISTPPSPRVASGKSLSDRENPTRAHSGREDSFRVRRFLFLLFRWRGWIALPLLASLCFPPTLLANPSGGLAIPGQAVISSHGSTLTVNQLTDRAILHWQDFSIAAGETTTFIQPSAASAALNRVFGSNPSAIHGTLSSNGQIFLINPNGILVGPTGVVDTGGFLASTLDISDENFLSGGDLRFKGNSDASVVNLGKISASSSDVILIARTVENHGEIHAPNGTAALAAGSEVLVKASGEERIFVEAGNAEGASKATQAGLIAAATAEIKAAGGNEYALAIKHTGVTRATGVQKRGGRVFLSAGGKSTIRHSGTITARKSSGDGGQVRVEAARIELAPESKIDASAVGNGGNGGKADGGEVLIGGGYQGQDPSIRNAETVTAEEGSLILADAAAEGDGGRVILWSDDTTRFAGTISARGGSVSGDGGFAEVSGKESLAMNGFADLRATNGAFGHLLLDPGSVVIQDGTDTAPPPANNIFNDAWIANQLGLGSVTIQTSASNAGSTETITVNGTVEIVWSAPATLTLEAGSNIVMNSGSLIENTHVGTNFDAIVLQANAVGAATGTFAGIDLNGATLRSARGNISLIGTGGATGSGNHGISLRGNALVESTGTGTITLNGDGRGGSGTTNHGIAMAGGAEVTSRAGNLLMEGRGGFGGRGIDLTSSSTVTSTGAAEIRMLGIARGDTGSTGKHGISLSSANTAILSSGSGLIHLTGQGGSAAAASNGGGHYGISVAAGTTVESTGTGAMQLHGHGGLSTGAAPVSGNIGVSVRGTVTSATGDILLVGVGGGHKIYDVGADTWVANPTPTVGLGFNHDGVQIATGGRVVSTGSANISFDGTAGLGTASSHGVYLSGIGVEVVSEGAGDIFLKGYGGIASSDNGIYMYNGSRITSSGTGSITLEGTRGTTNGTAGIRMLASASQSVVIESVSGAIHLIGQANPGAGIGILASSGSSSHGAEIISSSGAITLEAIGGSTGISLSSDSLNRVGTGSGGTPIASGNITLIADTIGVGNLTEIQSTGNLYIKPRTATGSIGVNGGAGGLQVNGAFLNAIQPGFTTVFVGSLEGSGAITINATNFNNHFSFLSGGVESTGGGGAISINGALTTAGRHISFFGDTVAFGTTGSIDTSNGVNPGGSVTLSVAQAFDTTAFAPGRTIVTGAGTADHGMVLINSAETIHLHAGHLLVNNSAAQNVYQLSATTSTLDGGYTGGGSLGNSLIHLITPNAQSSDGINTSTTPYADTFTGDFYLQAKRDIVWSKNLTVSDGSIIMRSDSDRNISGGTFVNSNISLTASNDVSLIGSAYGSSAGYGVTLYNNSHVKAGGNVLLQTTSGGQDIRMQWSGSTTSSIERTGTRNGRIDLISAGAITSSGSGTANIMSPSALSHITLTANTNINVATTLQIDSSGGDIAFRALGNITVSNAATDVAAGGGDILWSAGQDVVFVGTQSTNQAGRITLQAGGTIVGGSGASLTTQGGNILLNADRDASGGGNIQLTGTTIASNGGDITLGGGADPLSTAAVGIAVGSAATKAGIYLSGGALNSGAGAISLLGQGVAGTSAAYGIHVLGGAKIGTATGTGSITLDGTGGISTTAGTSGNHGVVITGTNTAISASAGAISLIGQGGQSADGTNYGIYVSSAAQVASTGTASVTLDGTGGVGANRNAPFNRYEGHNVGVHLQSANTLVTSVSGDVSITGRGGGGLLDSTDGIGGLNRGVLLNSAKVTSTGAAKVTLHGIGGTETAIANPGDSLNGQSMGVYIYNAGSGVESVDGDIRITGESTSHGLFLYNGANIEATGAADIHLVDKSDPGFAFYQGGVVSQLISNTGDIIIEADKWGAGNATSGSISSTGGAAAGRLIIRPLTAGTTIGIGGGNGTLDLSSTRLAFIQDGFSEIVIGNATAGNIIVNTANFTDNLRLVSAGNLAINGGLNTGSNQLALEIGGTTTQGASAPITASSLRLGGDGNFTLTNAANAVGILSKDGTGSVSLRNSTALTVGSVDGVNGVVGSTVDLRTSAGNLTLDEAVIASAAGNAVVLATSGNFINNAGTTAVQTPSGRWLIYSDGPAGNTFGGLASGQNALWNRTAATDPPVGMTETGHRYLFAETPSLTVTATLTDSKIYGDTYTFPAPVEGTHYTVSGFVDASTYGGVFLQDTATNIGLGGTPEFSSAGAANTATVVGSPYTVNIVQGTLSNMAGYTFSTFNSGGGLTVTPRDITVTALGGTSTYGDNPANPGLSATNLASFDTVSALTGLSNSFGIDSTSTVNTYTLSVTGTLTNSNYQVTATNTGSWSVTPRPLTVIADNQSKTYGDSFTFLGTEFTTSGLINGDTVTSATFASSGSVNTANVAGSPYAIAISGATGSGLGNYAITYQSGHFTVTPRAITVSANGGTSTYGDNPANPGLSATNLASFDDVSELTGLSNSFGIDGRTNAGTYTLHVSGVLTNGNYQITATSTGTWVVGQKALTVTADNQSKVYGDLFVFNGTEFTTSGLINDDRVLRAYLASAGSINTASAEGSPYLITIGGATGTGLDNYHITYIPGRMNVTPGPSSFVRNALLQTADMADPFSYLLAHPVEDDDLDSPSKGQIEFVPRDYPGTISSLQSGEVE